MQSRDQIRPGDRSGLKYVGLESIESGTGKFVDGDLSKTPETPRATSFHFDTRHVLYGKLRPYLNKVAVPEFEGKCSTELVPLLPGKVLDRRYLAYFLRSPAIVQSIDARTAGSRMPRADMDFLLGLEIPLPPLADQRGIVDLLSRAEGIVRLRREAQQKAAELIPAIFFDLFGDPTNAKRWPVATLGDLCIRITDGTHQPPPFIGTGIPFIFVTNIVDGELSLDTAKFISEDTYLELTRRCVIERGDVLYSTVGSYGVAVKVDTGERFCFQRHIAHIKPDRTKLDPDFLVGILSTPALKAQADSAARGIAQKTINLGEIRKFRIIAPSLDLQHQFAAKAEAVRGIVARQAPALATAQATFDALLHRAFAS